MDKAKWYEERAEERLRRLLANYGPERERTAFQRCGLGLTEEQFFGVVSKLAEQGFLERVSSAKRIGVHFLVPKDQVEQFVAQGTAD